MLTLVVKILCRKRMLPGKHLKDLCPLKDELDE